MCELRGTLILYLKTSFFAKEKCFLLWSANNRKAAAMSYVEEMNTRHLAQGLHVEALSNLLKGK